MNKVFITGKIVGQPVLRMEQGDVPHLIFGLSVRHRTKAGDVHKEVYPISAWSQVAQWGAENLQKGQIVGVQGYLAQRSINVSNVRTIVTEIAVDEFLPMLMTANDQKNVAEANEEAAE